MLTVPRPVVQVKPPVKRAYKRLAEWPSRANTADAVKPALPGDWRAEQLAQLASWQSISMSGFIWKMLTYLNTAEWKLTLIQFCQPPSNTRQRTSLQHRYCMQWVHMTYYQILQNDDSLPFISFKTNLVFEKGLFVLFLRVKSEFPNKCLYYLTITLLRFGHVKEFTEHLLSVTSNVTFPASGFWC